MWLMLAGLMLACSLGCMQRSQEEFRASPENARRALETALTAWRDGQPVGEIRGGPVTIQAVDSRWKAGKKLEQFEILSEEAGQTAVTVFSVRLKLKGAATPEMLRYMVVGRDPLWVYREEDFKGQSGM
jgi:hypothetical protein